MKQNLKIMKTKKVFYSILSLSFLILAISIVSCKKDENTTTTNTSKVYLLSKDSTVGTYTYVREYTYNSSKKLVKVSLLFSSTLYQYDTLYYNTDGTLQKVYTYLANNPTTPSATKTYTFSSGKMTSVAETGTNNNGLYSRTRTFTYATSGLPLTATVNYSIGASEGYPENYTNMEYDNGNIIKARLTGAGPVVATTEVTAPNPYLGMNIETSSIDVLFNRNNITMARMDTLTNDVFFTRTYTYTNGRVAKVHSVESSQTFDRWFFYKEY